jgi:Tfp pilus assembly protein PilX
MRPASDDLISCIVPVYNGERYLSEALDSNLIAHAQNFWIPELREGEARYRDHARVQAVPSLNCCPTSSCIAASAVRTSAVGTCRRSVTSVWPS